MSRCGLLASMIATAVVGSSCGSEPPSSPSSIACDEIAGRAEEVVVDERTALVHLPPCYDSSVGAYPSVYLLHGGGMDPRSWIAPSIGADVIADRLMVDGDIAPVVLVFVPRSTIPSGFVDRVMDPLIEAVEGEFRVIERPGSRAIGGFSAGGPATGLAGLSGPPRFGAVGFFAVIWSDTAAVPVAESMAERSDRPAIRIDIGDRDNLRSNVERLERDLDALGLESEFTVVPGSHDLEFVADRMDDWLVWFDAQLR